jgi:hypothetical protein
VNLSCTAVQAAKPTKPPQITAPPKSLNIPSFYKKYVDCGGLPIVSSEKVPDAALFKVAELTDQILAGRPDIRQAMIAKTGRIMVVGAKEGITELPEYSRLKPKEFWNKRSRGFGGGRRRILTSVGEENVLCLPDDRYDDESIFIHEFSHSIHATLRLIDRDKGNDKGFDETLREIYDKAVAKGLWSNTYAGSSRTEYWAEAVQSWFDANRENNYNHNHINTREELKAYDPDLAKLVEETLRLTGKKDWRYKPLARRPQVTAPAAALKCDPFYKKHVRARLLPVLSSDKAPDAALLEANYLVRQMFAYRHDILQDMTGYGLRFVVLGEKDKLADIPELKGSNAATAGDKASRVLSCTAKRKMIACGAENLLASKGDPHAGESILIREFARAVHVLTALRPFDEEFENRSDRYKETPQRGVTRIDVRLDATLKKLHKKAIAKGLWKNTIAAGNHVDYWVEGVQSWFDANAQDCPGHSQVNTRKELEAYDPALAKLIAELFLHPARMDWRYKPPAAR